VRFRRGRWLFFAFGFDWFTAFFFSKDHPLSAIEALAHLAPFFPVDFKISASAQRAFRFHLSPHLFARGPRQRATWPRLERYVVVSDGQAVIRQRSGNRANDVL
jgi:hypothetical protein